MKKNLPNIFIFLDKYNSKIFENNNLNAGVIYRNYGNVQRDIELTKIAKACKKNRYHLFVSNDIKLAIKLKADGIYIPSFNRKKKFFNLAKKLTILGSAHNQQEIQKKISQNCTAIFLSPVFNVKKSKNFLNVNKFNLISRANKINMFALGGITRKNLNKLRILNIRGFGGIDIFKKKPAFKRPVFLKNNFF